jgi:uncharacterized protein (DUF1015 family)
MMQTLLAAARLVREPRLHSLRKHRRLPRSANTQPELNPAGLNAQVPPAQVIVAGLQPTLAVRDLELAEPSEQSGGMRLCRRRRSQARFRGDGRRTPRAQTRRTERGSTAAIPHLDARHRLGYVLAVAIVRPFRAYRPPQAHAARVASPPYDVISTAEARALAAGGLHSFLHVSRPEIDLPEGTDEHDDAVYARGAENLAALVSGGDLAQDQEPHLYLYAQKMGGHRQIGVVGCASVAEYEKDVIKKHEKTRADKEDDRTRHIEELRAHDEPVFLTYRADPGIDRAVAHATASPPIYDFTTADGVEHRLWVLGREATAELAARFEHVPTLYVADGHHRSAAAARVHKKLRGDGGEHDVFLAVVFPHDQMNIMPYNRVVRDLQGRSADALLAALGERLDVAPAPSGAAAAPPGPKAFGVYLGGRWFTARVRHGTYDAKDPVASLDCSLCQEQILGPVFGVTDPRRDKHVDFVGGIRGIAELERRVDSGDFTVGLHLYPTQIGELFAVSDAGLLMPPKSTWFEPKLRSGLFVHVF